MWMHKEKKSKRRNLLEMSEVERIKLIRGLKESLRQKAAEAKLQRMFLESENLTINGRMLHCEEASMTGLSLKSDLFKGL